MAGETHGLVPIFFVAVAFMACWAARHQEIGKPRRKAWRKPKRVSKTIDFIIITLARPQALVVPDSDYAPEPSWLRELNDLRGCIHVFVKVGLPSLSLHRSMVG